MSFVRKNECGCYCSVPRCAPQPCVVLRVLYCTLLLCWCCLCGVKLNKHVGFLPFVLALLYSVHIANSNVSAFSFPDTIKNFSTCLQGAVSYRAHAAIDPNHSPIVTSHGDRYRGELRLLPIPPELLSCHSMPGHGGQLQKRSPKWLMEKLWMIHPNPNANPTPDPDPRHTRSRRQGR